MRNSDLNALKWTGIMLLGFWVIFVVGGIIVNFI